MTACFFGNDNFLADPYGPSGHDSTAAGKRGERESN